MAREAGARKVYIASAAPPVRYPNVYGIDMPAAHELVAHGRSEAEIAAYIGADWLIYQDLPDLIDAVQKGNRAIQQFDCSCFDGVYVTSTVGDDYLNKISNLRSDSVKNSSDDLTIVVGMELHNNA
jgi:amidophosphoribosyltransferase